MTINERVFFLLENQQLKQIELARFLGVDRSNITAWKKRNTEISAKFIAPLSAFLGVSEHYLLTGEKDEEKDKTDTLLLQLFHSMNDEGKEKALEQLEFFASKYKKHSVAKMVD